MRRGMVVILHILLFVVSTLTLLCFVYSSLLFSVLTTAMVNKPRNMKVFLLRSCHAGSQLWSNQTGVYLLSPPITAMMIGYLIRQVLHLVDEIETEERSVLHLGIMKQHYIKGKCIQSAV